MLFNGAGVNRTLSYNAANQLSEVRIAGTVSSYLYDHRGLRGRKTLSNPPAGVPAITLYTHDPNGHLFQEIAGSGPNIGQALVTYLWQDDVPAAIVLGPNTPGNPSAQDKLLYLEVDHLNTPRIARDEQKRVVWRWDSDAFGNTAPNEDPDGDGIKTTINLRFPGQYFDAESGLHYNWHRYYDPQVGRYTQPDPIGVEGGLNPYAYVDGSPIAGFDPQGLANSGWRPSPGFGDLRPSGSDPLGHVGGAGGDFSRNYGDMRNANTIGGDKYFHCKANCQSARRGKWGDKTACTISDAREWTDQNVKGDPASASASDQFANVSGRSGGATSRLSCEQVCGPFRPRGLSGQY